MSDSQRTTSLYEFVETHNSTCPNCDYALVGLRDAFCPECGVVITVESIEEAKRKWPVVYNISIVGFLFSSTITMIAFMPVGLVYIVGFVFWIIYGRQISRLPMIVQFGLAISIWLPLMAVLIALALLIITDAIRLW